MDSQLVLYALLGLGAVWTVIWLAVITHASRSEPEAVVTAGAARLRKRLVYPLLAVLAVALLASLYWLPYPIARSRTLGTPEMTIDVSALQWGWVVSQSKIPAHVPVEFALTSRDVNHDFAIYSPQGQLVTQAQVMPGFTNRLIYEFDQPGVYLVRCLEYCGLGHDGMITQLVIA
jgi:cytochrome c oxidase subunit 2